MRGRARGRQGCVCEGVRGRVEVMRVGCEGEGQGWK